MSIITVHDPIFSRLQSALHHTLTRHAVAAGLDPAHPSSPSAELSSGHPAMQTVASLGNAATGTPVPDGVVSKGAVDEECAKLALQYMRARCEGNEVLAQQIQDELKFSNCDPLWAE